MMAYQEGIVASIMVDGKPLREFNHSGRRTCKIPFGSEYSIRLKNKSNLRALISVDIDGTDVLCYKQLVMRPHDQIQLERFVDELDSGSKFKFISLEEGIKTGEIQDPTSKENGIIRIKYYKERPFINHRRIIKTDRPNNYEITYTSASACTNGATVEGGHSNQQFNMTDADFPTELIPGEIIIKLVGIRNREKFGVYLNNNKKPTYEFNDRLEAYNFVKINDFGISKVIIKPI